MRRGPSLEPRRKLGASYGKETRNGGPYNVSACDGPRGHTHVHQRRSVTLALSRIFRILSLCLPRVYRHVISQPRPSPFLRRYHLPRKSKRARNGEGLGPRLSLALAPSRGYARDHAHRGVVLFRGFCFCSLPYTFRYCSLTRALSKSLPHAQQLFSASTPSQILAPRLMCSMYC